VEITGACPRRRHSTSLRLRYSIYLRQK
jgi:hypothetical protein